MKQKNRWWLVAICLTMMMFAMGCSANDSENVVDVSNVTSSTGDVKDEGFVDFAYDNFADKQEWKYGVLLGDNQILSFDTPLYCTDLTTGGSRPLCSVEDCVHNNLDCQAIFDAHYGCDFVYCYNEKIYAASVVGNSIRIKCADANESTHETVAYDVLEGDINLSGYYVYEDKLYIGASVENADKEHLINDDGSYMVYQHPSIYCFDFVTGELELVYRDEKGDYGVTLEILYAHEDVLYFDSGEPDGKLITLDVVNETVSEVEGYDDGDYLGCHGDVDYYAICDENGYQTGDVLVVNRTDNGENKIHLGNLPKDELIHCDIHLLENGFVVNEQSIEEETGTMTFYDMDGKQTDVVEDCSFYVIGEHQGFYLLGEYTYDGIAFAYAKKKDVKLADSKERNRRMVVLHP